MGDEDLTNILTEAQGERIRVNAKANSKGQYAFDVTFEDTGEKVDVEKATNKVLDAIQLLHRKFKAGSIPIAGE